MDVGEQSVKFIESQIESNYREVMDGRIIEDMYWMDTDDGARAVATTIHLHEKDDKGKDFKTSKVIVLFPPFVAQE